MQVITPTGTIEISSMDELIRVEEVSVISGLSRRSVDRLVRSGWAPQPIMFHKKKMYIRWEIEDWCCARILREAYYILCQIQIMTPELRDKKFHPSFRILINIEFDANFNKLSESGKDLVKGHRVQSDPTLFGPYLDKRRFRKPNRLGSPNLNSLKNLQEIMAYRAEPPFDLVESSHTQTFNLIFDN